MEHLCNGEWVEGPVRRCDTDNHGQRLHRMPKMRIGPKTRRKLDREAGKVGTDRGDHIAGIQ